MKIPLNFFKDTKMSNKIKELRNLERETADKYYRFDYCNANQNPVPRQNKVKTYNDIKPSEWLKDIDGSRKINSLSIPGTHDSGARFRGPFSRTQHLSIQEQLLNGVRYLDIRCRHINNCFMIHHTRKFQYLGFGGGVLDVCINFLKEHPTEFIYMQIMQEYSSLDNTSTFFDTIKSYFTGLEEFLFFDEISPTLDQVRGKIVILRRFDSPITPFGNQLNFRSLTFTSNTTITARIQDAYQVKSLCHRSLKWERFLDLMKEAQENTDEDKLFIDFGSGSTTFCYPFSTAQYMVPRIGNYLKNTNPDKFVGVIMFDFITDYYDDIIYYLLKRNFN